MLALWSTTVTDIKGFLHLVEQEVVAARAKFPSSNHVTVALMEEAGELAKAMMDEPWGRVVAEAVQVAAMAARCAIEGDPTMQELRRERIGEAYKKGKLVGAAAGFGPRCPYLGCHDPYNARPPCALCYE